MRISLSDSSMAISERSVIWVRMAFCFPKIWLRIINPFLTELAFILETLTSARRNRLGP